MCEAQTPEGGEGACDVNALPYEQFLLFNLTLQLALQSLHCVFSFLFFILPHASIVTAPSSQLEREIAKQDRRTKVKDLDKHRTEAAERYRTALEKLPHRPGEASEGLQQPSLR